MRPDKTMLEMLRARVSQDQERSIEAAARRRGITLSEFVREAAVRASGSIAA